MEKSNGISLQKQKKQEVIENLAKDFSAASSIYLLNYEKITVAKDNALRMNLRKKGVVYKAAKNRLIREALKKANISGRARLYMATRFARTS